MAEKKTAVRTQYSASREIVGMWPCERCGVAVEVTAYALQIATSADRALIGRGEKPIGRKAICDECAAAWRADRAAHAVREERERIEQRKREHEQGKREKAASIMDRLK